MREPLTLHLPARLDEEFNIAKLLAQDPRWSWSFALTFLKHFELKSHEMAFVRTLFTHRSNLWIFRTHQQQSCGDFVVVDMSVPTPRGRTAFIIELKEGKSLRQGGNDLQMANHRAAIQEIAEVTGIIEPDSLCERLFGSSRAILEYFNVETNGA